MGSKDSESRSSKTRSLVVIHQALFMDGGRRYILLNEFTPPMPVALTKYRIKDLTQITAEPDLLNKVIELENATGTDKNFKVTVPTLIQTVANNLPGTNRQKSAYKSVRTYDTLTTGYLPGYDTLLGLDPETLCLGTLARVEFPLPSRDYILVYDANASLYVYTDGGFSGGKNPARWVEKNSVDEAVSAIKDFNPFEAKYTKGDNVKYTLGGSLRLFTARQDLVKTTFTGNQQPAPTGLLNDPYWQEINAEVAPNFSRLGQLATRFYYNSERDQYGGDTVEDLIARENAGAGILFTNREVTVELGPNAGRYKVVYDNVTPEFDAWVDGSFTNGRNPCSFVKVDTSGSGTISLSNITENVGGFHAGESFTGTTQEAFNKLLITFQNPSFSTFSLDNQGSRTLLTGTVFQNQNHSFDWATNNGSNIKPNTVSISDLTNFTTLVTNTTNDGTETLAFGGFTIGVGESRRYRITADTTNGNTIAADVVLYGALARFWGASALTPSQLKAQLTSGQSIDPGALNFQVDLASTISNNITVDCTGGKYVYFLFDANLPNPSLVRAGVNTFSAYTLETLNITDQLGNSRAYKLLATGIQYSSAVNVNVVN